MFLHSNGSRQGHSKYHDNSTGIRARIGKKNSGSTTVKYAVEVGLCLGWIDAIRRSYDAVDLHSP
ncbi:MAG: hypothetical protein IPI00_00235 [Flavobacteriales bacterium]|nr:hypothetical protein [Flavobacteriales bacterium]MBK9536472.1 hypothetical protein [Flavobacteriales bacterium]MBP9137375.1 hypothetical protein [Flavobacteriales bacterium]HQX28717.1 hypothetical protein [Flavobacteriales bacterium]HQX37375.1 hypothetical protein [Flavobacteriales bacterium]